MNPLAEINSKHIFNHTEVPNTTESIPRYSVIKHTKTKNTTMNVLITKIQNLITFSIISSVFLMLDSQDLKLLLLIVDLTKN